MYQFTDEINHENFFQIEKSLIKTEDVLPDTVWRKLPLSTKSIYPVIGCHAGKNGIAYPGQESIAALSGMDVDTVRKGVEYISDIPSIELKERYTGRGVLQRKWEFPKINNYNEKIFSFYRAVLESGCWRMLRKECRSEAAHAVYCTLLAHGWFEFDLYAEVRSRIDEKEVDLNEREFFDLDDGRYPYRDYDFVFVDEVQRMAYLSGVSEKTYRKAIEALKEVKLLEPIPEEFYHKPVCRIFRKPPIRYTRECLNKQLT